MKYVSFFISAGCLFFFRGISQTIPNLQSYKTTAAKLDMLGAYCDSLLNSSSLDALNTVALYALSITPANDFNNQSIFNCYLGNACEGTTASDTVCIKHYITALNYARRSNDIIHIIDAAGPLMVLYDDLHDSAGVVKRDSMSVELRRIADTSTSDYAKADVMEWLVQYYISFGRNDTALQYSLKAVDIAKRLYAKGKEPGDFVANAIYRLTQSFINMNQGEKRLPYLLEMRTYLPNTNISLLAVCYLRTAEDYMNGKQPDKAELYYDSLEHVAVAAKNNALLWNNCIELDVMFSQNYLAKYKNTDKAMFYAERAVELGRKWGYATWQANINYTMGFVLLRKEEYKKALPFFITGASLARPQYMLLYSACIRKISQAYAGMGNWELAFRYADTANVLKDSLAKVNTDKSFADAEEQYQNKEKQQQIEIKNVQLAAGKQQKFWLMAGAALLSAVIVLLIIIYRNKKRTADMLGDKNETLGKLNSALEEANQTKARLFSIIGHDLRSPINQVYQFLKLQQLNPGMLSDEQKGELSRKIQTATGSLLETMEDLLLWSKTQMKQFAADFQQAFLHPLVTQVTTLLHLNSEAKGIIVTNNLPESARINTDPYFLQTILRNLLQNAIKANPVDGSVVIDSHEDNNNFVLTIQNSGTTFTQQQYEDLLAVEETGKSLTGLGLRLVNELSFKIGARICFSTSPSGDTVSQIIFPAM